MKRNLRTIIVLAAVIATLGGAGYALAAKACCGMPDTNDCCATTATSECCR